MGGKINFELMRYFFCLVFIGLLISCGGLTDNVEFNEPDYTVDNFPHIQTTKNVLDYHAAPTSYEDRDYNVFSAEGAWFGFSLSASDRPSFPGPFDMGRENGKWLSIDGPEHLVKLDNHQVQWTKDESNSYASHLEQSFKGEGLSMKQYLIFDDGAEVIIRSFLKNESSSEVSVQSSWQINFLETGDSASLGKRSFERHQPNQNLMFVYGCESRPWTESTPNDFKQEARTVNLAPGEEIFETIHIIRTFPGDSFLEFDFQDIDRLLFHQNFKRVKEKEEERLKKLVNLETHSELEQIVLAKSFMTLKNNFRLAEGELKHNGYFPSYHYVWFNGFWAWDSWKHAAAVAKYDTDRAKDQIRAMLDYQDSTGFIYDCIFRDTTIEKHNKRNTKPPLASWAVQKIYDQTEDIEFIEEVFEQLLLHHDWWYEYRDHDGDWLCEYGSTDGNLIAAKWESGMDNAVRFDDSRILKNSNNAYSMNQESVDLNAFLYLDKVILSHFAALLKKDELSNELSQDAQLLRVKIQDQFFDDESGWFYDTDLEGNLIKNALGCEGWIPLWVNAASNEQAERVKENLMRPDRFNTKMPFGTMQVLHPQFDPMDGYWRGPVWLDQVYFGIKGLQQYGYKNEATEILDKVLNNAAGLTERGPTIRENYHPLSGQGLNAHNFSWSAAHLILLLSD